MNIQLKLSGSKKDFSKLMIRLYQGKFDISANTNILIPVDSWDSKKQSCKDFDLNLKIQKFKIHIAEKFNSDYMSGINFDREWLLVVIQEYFNRNVDEKNFVNPGHKIYFYDFSKWWLDNHSSKWKVSASEFMGEKLKDQYTRFLDKILDYEKENGRIKLLSTSNEFMYDFISHLKSLNYGSGTIKKQMDYLKFFCNRATEHGFLVNKGFKQRIFIPEDNAEVEGVYLTEDEIQRIWELDLSQDEQLDNIRDLLLISLFSGLRISDFMYNLKTENIKDGFIEIKTQKTKTFVKIPAHNIVRMILNKRFGQLPNKTSSTTYNKKIKDICEMAKIDQVIFGSVMDKKKNRKVFGYFKKFELITSHSARRSLCTNLSGKVSDEVIMSVMGWTNTKMVDKYNKTTKSDYANQLQKYWSEN